MDQDYEELFERIRTRCRQQRWHGPDISNPFTLVEQERLRQQKAAEALERQRKEHPERKGWFAVGVNSTSYWYDRYGKQYAINAETDLESFPLQADFEYAPATEEELATTERYLGYPLPPLLRALYGTVADGGFGPGYGLDGIRWCVQAAETEKNPPRPKSARPIDLAIYLQKYSAQEYFEFPWYVWPDSLFPLCHWGCGYFSHLDRVSGRVFFGGAGKEGYGLHLQALSLYEWLDLWLKGVNLEKWESPASGE